MLYSYSGFSEYLQYQRNRNPEFPGAISSDSCNEESFSFENELIQSAHQLQVAY